ncbi:hypothetical protein HDE_02107 [Halotydeus destructor]|nr:hypothetical protein HDE_02107 [Halotydeus destructor]
MATNESGAPLTEEQRQRLEAYQRQVADTQRALEAAQVQRQISQHEQQVAQATALFQAHQAANAQLPTDEERSAHHQDFVRQFHQLYPGVKSIMHKLPEHHLGEEEFLAKLHLKQGSVVQFPRNAQTTKFDFFEPPEEPYKVGLGLASGQHPDNILPSRAREQQTYMTHPSRGPSKLEVRGVTPPPVGDPQHPGKPVGVRQAHWPPKNTTHDGQKTGFHVEGGPKTVVWPPPRREMHRSCLDLGPPKGAAGAGRMWNPSSLLNLNDPSALMGKNYSPVKKVRQWPPTQSYGQRRQQSMDNLAGRRDLDQMLDTSGHPVVGMYRPPPWCQFYGVNRMDDIQVQNA